MEILSLLTKKISKILEIFPIVKLTRARKFQYFNNISISSKVLVRAKVSNSIT